MPDGRDAASTSSGRSVAALRLENGRRIYVLDGALREELTTVLCEQLQSLPYELNDVDRLDTAHVRHLVHTFDPHLLANGSAFRKIAALAREVLAADGLGAGGVRRGYVNMNLHGDFQYAHADGDVWTVLLFGNTRWEPDWLGELMFHDSVYIHAVTPKPGRIVIFDGLIMHRGGAPSKLCSDPRLTLVLKLSKAAE